ncbi:hypothetical protein DV515_00008433 [Chloebia gouldiae]|uniref:Uncharacterized protein n=1 Tax=Chloebia gouldiae TaxID=44316 RepID=A0A3L8SF50_CHLGU|nr:hypothetical protein DV515_00008433 [Chloebia gouldiae]
MFALCFETIEPKWKTPVEGIMFHFLSPERGDLAKDLFCFVIVWLTELSQLCWWWFSFQIDLEFLTPYEDSETPVLSCLIQAPPGILSCRKRYRLVAFL